MKSIMLEDLDDTISRLGTQIKESRGFHQVSTTAEELLAVLEATKSYKEEIRRLLDLDGRISELEEFNN